MLFCVYSHGAAHHIALHSSSNADVRHSTIGVVVGHNAARKDSELQVGRHLCRTFWRWSKVEAKSGTNLPIASDLKVVVVLLGEKTPDSKGLNAVCVTRVNAFLKQFDLIINKDFQEV